MTCKGMSLGLGVCGEAYGDAFLADIVGPAAAHIGLQRRYDDARLRLAAALGPVLPTGGGDVVISCPSGGACALEVHRAEELVVLAAVDAVELARVRSLCLAQYSPVLHAANTLIVVLHR